MNYSFIVLLTALEMAHGETPRWHAGSVNRLGCTKKRISLQNTCLQFHLRALATNAPPHCAHDTKLHRLQIQKNHTKLAGYGQQKTTLPGPADGQAGLKQDSIQHLRRMILTPKLPLVVTWTPFTFAVLEQFPCI